MPLIAIHGNTGRKQTGAPAHHLLVATHALDDCVFRTCRLLFKRARSRGLHRHEYYVPPEQRHTDREEEYHGGDDHSPRGEI